MQNVTNGILLQIKHGMKTWKWFGYALSYTQTDPYAQHNVNIGLCGRHGYPGRPARAAQMMVGREEMAACTEEKGTTRAQW